MAERGARRTKLIKMIGLLRVPEEKHPVQILVELKQNMAEMPQLQNMHPFSRLVNNPQLFKWHIAQLPDTEGPKLNFHASKIIAEWKLHHADSLQQLESWLEPTEILALLRHPDCLEQLKKIGKQCL
jgi:membrane glycosyltransferase